MNMHQKTLVLVGTSRESVSLPVFQAACEALQVRLEFLPYARGEAPRLHGDIIYFRDPFNMGANATDSQFVASLAANNPDAVYVDDLQMYDDLFFEDKLVQYGYFSSVMPATSVLTQERYESGDYDSGKYLVKERLNAGGKGVFFGKGFAFQEDTFLLQEKINIEYDYRIICLNHKIMPYGLKRIAKHDNDSVSKTVDVYELTEADIDFANKVLELAPSYDLLGLDVAIDGDRHYLIEANRSPQIKIFQARTGIDIAKELIVSKLDLLR